jgi:hypothetical protein
MKNKNVLSPLFRTIDKIIFGIEEVNETEEQPEFIEIDNEEEFDVKRSIN